jgi:hypothetical protein
MLALHIFALALLPLAWAKAPPLSVLSSALCPFSPKAAKAILSHELLHQLPAAEVKAIFEERAKLYGKCERLEPAGEHWRLVTADGSKLALEMEFNGAGKITDFAFGAVELEGDSLKKVEEFGRRAFPRFSYFLSEDEKEIASSQKDLPLNVGKAAQLFLLTALQKRVASGSLKPESVATLEPRLFRLAVGPLKLWPAGTKLSVDSLKSFMLIENDTVAADLLLETVGRERVEEEAAGLKPFLSFQELHALQGEHAPANVPPRLKPAEQIELARSLLAKATAEADFQPMPPKQVGHLGWFASTRALCAALRSLSNEPSLPHTQAAEGTRARLEAHWGGVITVQVREGGVAQSTLLAKNRRSGKQVCLSVTANGEEEISTSAFDDISDRILKVIR